MPGPNSLVGVGPMNLSSLHLHCVTATWLLRVSCGVLRGLQVCIVCVWECAHDAECQQNGVLTLQLCLVFD